ncbi:hypothetical protein EDB80DRAFT_719384 [Ilyonectria destructans]|nr:hypothetical protein EDB80DRAFT_719384 [Ilyonectria destructans]
MSCVVCLEVCVCALSGAASAGRHRLQVVHRRLAACKPSYVLLPAQQPENKKKGYLYVPCLIYLEVESEVRRASQTDAGCAVSQRLLGGRRVSSPQAG